MHTAQALGLKDHAVEHCEHVVNINFLETAIRLLFEDHGGKFFAVLDHGLCLTQRRRRPDIQVDVLA
ncbi:hypothetical protein PS662_05086 [Pseudomonas fluorescens]|uniref:Uncharacterized protein n=1 Tax=Pseudomonas fluorescens TaxID=294 RepID=A0A5E6X144_PSEFL|nr:hypothetical protein [Pseudomonas fluorescens]VVN34696.1 hypothetical protein PS662_05086 [Pseudomonas fluorescens]